MQKMNENHLSGKSMWVTWVNCKLIEDMMVVNDVVKFNENRMRNQGDAYTRLNI